MIRRTNTEFLRIEEDIVVMLERLLAEMPPNVASLEVHRVGRFKEGLQATLTPRNSGAASLWVHVENGSAIVDLGFGPWGNSWELPTEGRNPKAGKEELLHEVTQLCKAVIAGNCQYKWGLLSRTASISVEGGPPYKITDIPVFRKWPHLRYEPYTS